jgi:hypothetical protein
MNCTLITDHCLACGTGEGYWKGYANAKFPQNPSDYPHPYQTNVIGGINNSKNFRTSASSFTLLKKALTTVQPIPNNLPSNLNSGGNGPTNVGGPGDAVKSVPIITNMATSGLKTRLNVKATQTGVDVKHNSYERYLARKRGFNMRCPGQNC